MYNAIPGLLREIQVVVLENGYLVIVHSPPLSTKDAVVEGMERMGLGMASMIQNINKAGGAGFVQGADEEIDGYKENDEDRAKKQAEKAKRVQEEIKKAFKDMPPPARPYETYVFLDKKKLVAFLDEVLVKPVGVPLSGPEIGDFYAGPA